jgi:hypothetical protein
MSDTVLQVVFGVPSPQRVRTPYKDTFATTAPLILALCLALGLGTHLPAPLRAMLDGAVLTVDGHPLPVHERSLDLTKPQSLAEVR